ncbi:major facilitator superfamily domain-containing protein, partial [Lineolata rhizophorae]
PKDRGPGAWKFLFGTCMMEAFCWGFALSFGIFQSHYANHPLFSSHASAIPVIGTLSNGLSYLLLPLTNAITLRFPNPTHQRLLSLVGWLLCLGSLVLASFATRVWHLLASQGALFGLGWAVCYTPYLLMLNGWFERRRGLAYGVMFGASGLSGCVMPELAGWLLARWDFRVALRAHAGLIAACTGPCYLVIKPRVPADGGGGGERRRRRPAAAAPTAPSFLRAHAFLLRPRTYPHLLATLVQGLPSFLPNIFLPAYARALDLAPSTGPLLLTVLSLAQVAGQISLGALSDHTPPSLAPTLCSALAAAAVFALWAPATGAPALFGFAAAWG